MLQRHQHRRAAAIDVVQWRQRVGPQKLHGELVLHAFRHDEGQQDRQLRSGKQHDGLGHCLLATAAFPAERGRLVQLDDLRHDILVRAEEAEEAPRSYPAGVLNSITFVRCGQGLSWVAGSLDD